VRISDRFKSDIAAISITDLAIRSLNPKMSEEVYFRRATMIVANKPTRAKVLLSNTNETATEFVIQVVEA
jgi:hypothetical protein